MESKIRTWFALSVALLLAAPRFAEGQTPAGCP